jgi:hypothetical protein
MVSGMIIKGTFENGHIRILSGIEQLPEGTEVLITPITLDSEANCDLENLRNSKLRCSGLHRCRANVLTILFLVQTMISCFMELSKWSLSTQEYGSLFFSPRIPFINVLEFGSMNSTKY